MGMSSHFAAGGLAVVVAGVAVLRVILHFKWGRCSNFKSLKGKTVIITGANSGIGKATALELAKRDAQVIMACRDINSASEAVKYIRKYTSNGELLIKELNLASFKSIHSFVEDFKSSQKPLDVLVNNAGVFESQHRKTEDGFEMCFGVNHLGHFLLTKLLLENLKKTKNSRVVIVSSIYYKYGDINFNDLNLEQSEFSSKKAYSNSKLANILFGLELHQRLKGTGVDVFMLSPGVVWTNLGRNMQIPLWKKILLAPFAIFILRTPDEGCQTILHCSLSDELIGKSGLFYRNCKEAELDYSVVKMDTARQLWAVSERLTISN